MAKKKYYAVKKGKTPGIYLTWNDCKAQTDGYSGAIYKSFQSAEEAENFVRQQPLVEMGQKMAKKRYSLTKIRRLLM